MGISRAVKKYQEIENEKVQILYVNNVTQLKVFKKKPHPPCLSFAPAFFFPLLILNLFLAV